MLTSIESNKTLLYLKDQLLEIMNDRGIMAKHSMSPLSKITNLENTSRYKLVKDSNPNRVNDLLKNNTLPVTLCNNLLTYRDTNKQTELKRNFLKMIINTRYNVDFAYLPNRNLMYVFAKVMHFDKRGPGNKRISDRSLIRLLKAPDIMASRISAIIQENPNEFCDRLKSITARGTSWKQFKKK